MPNPEKSFAFAPGRELGFGIMKDDESELPTQADQALYLIAELLALIDRASPEDWPQSQRDLFASVGGRSAPKQV